MLILELYHSVPPHHLATLLTCYRPLFLYYILVVRSHGKNVIDRFLLPLPGPENLKSKIISGMILEIDRVVCLELGTDTGIKI